jgi:5-methylcytosine-specific restriction endonuclease McrA
VTKYGAICYICGDPFDKSGDITFDHWEPISKGGEDNLDNYRLAHYSCNQLKADMKPELFLEFQRGEIKYE